MSRERYDRVAEVFREALEREPEERDAYLDEACGEDVELREEIEAMLVYDRDDSTKWLAEAQLEEGAELIARTIASPSGSESHPLKVGKYRILRLIGQGGMGHVYMAEQENPRRNVAIKLLRPGVVAPGVLRRFEYESQVLGRLQHPGIAQIFEAGTFDAGAGTQPYFAMELVDGKHLNDQAAFLGIETNQRLELIARICDAVQHAHQKGVIHRDLKPDNILVDPSGQPKILDFGVARTVDADSALTTVEKDVGQIIGTLAYMSPEQVSDTPEDVDSRSDVYSLGVLAYELLTGNLPYEIGRRTLTDAIRIIREQEARRISSIDRTLRGDVETIIANALEKSRDRRYGSAAEMAADIRRYLRDEPITARPPSAVYQIRKFAKRHRPIVGGMAIAALALIMATVVSTRQAIVAGRARGAEKIQREEAERRFDEVRSLARTFIFDFFPMLEDLPGSMEARKLLVTTALAYLDSLAQGGPDDPDLILEIAVAYMELGDIQGAPGVSNLGDLNGALTSYQESHRLYDELGTKGLGEERDKEIKLSLASLEGRMGPIYLQMGRVEEALVSFRRSVEEVEAVAARDSEDRSIQRSLALAINGVGDVHKEMGHFEKALPYYRRCLEIRRKLVRDNPRDDELRRSLSVSYTKVGDIETAMGYWEEALVSFRESHEIRLEFSKAWPDSPGCLRDLAFTYGRIGNTLVSLGRVDEALQSYERSREIREQLVRAEPTSLLAQRDWLAGIMRIGTVQESTGDLEGARISYQESLRLGRSLTRGNRANVQLRRDLGICHLRVADVEMMAEEFDEARDHYAMGLEILEPLVAANPDVATLQAKAAVHSGLGMVEFAEGKLALASSHHRSALEVRERILSASPGDETARRGLCESYSSLGATRAKMAEEVSLSIAERLEHLYRARSWFQRSQELLTSLEKEGILHASATGASGEISAEISRCHAAIAELELQN